MDYQIVVGLRSFINKISFENEDEKKIEKIKYSEKATKFCKILNVDLIVAT